MRFATKAIRVGQNPDSDYRAVVNPIYQTSTYSWSSLAEVPPVDYTRCANPNRHILEQVIASLENGAHCTVFASGMAAITAAGSLAKAGDHVLVASDIYGGTFRLKERVWPLQGIECGEFDASDPASLEEAIRPNTRLVVYESPTNPILRVVDIAAIADVCRRRGVVSVFDNTFASPCLQNPLDLGVDVVVHSNTKYINGHSDVVGGCTVTNDPDIGNAMCEWLKMTGAAPSPFDCWLTLRGLKTLEVRMARHCSNAQTLAERLERHPKVRRVHYPGLPSHPDHDLAKRQMRAFGAMMAIEVGDSAQDAARVAEGFQVVQLAESLGGVESLVAYPPLMSHATMTEEQRLERGILPNLLRISVGIEDPDDLLEDFERALSRI
ncbi:MAG: trans-sulfuration enzyme family protein [Fimbriimonadaceae bacterium]